MRRVRDMLHDLNFFLRYVLRTVFLDFYIRVNLSRALRAEGTA